MRLPFGMISSVDETLIRLPENPSIDLPLGRARSMQLCEPSNQQNAKVENQRRDQSDGCVFLQSSFVIGPALKEAEKIEYI